MPSILPLGDSAITVSFGEGISEELSGRVVQQAARICAVAITGVTDVVPAYAALAVSYDPLAISFADLSDRLRAIFEESAGRQETGIESVVHTIPVTYDGEDLAEVTHRTGLTTDDVIRIHSEREYRVYVMGFAPGFAYLGTLDERLALPRRDSPRKRVPPGSVAIAERQTGIYPSPTPGGWHLIGTTSEKLFDPTRENPSLLKVGDRVKFHQ